MTGKILCQNWRENNQFLFSKQKQRDQSQTDMPSILIMKDKAHLARIEELELRELVIT